MEASDPNESAAATCSWKRRGLMSAVEKCIQVTESLLELARISHKNDRDETIGKIDDLLNQRETLLPLIKGPFSTEEKSAGKRLIQLNEELNLHLGKMRMHIQRDINELEHKKTTAERYSNPYAAAEQLDGMFYDKRK
ncbi:flagellar protein FliT [Lederbergia citrea]|uniref:flagellar protein FliT n=1 Tax=Lederbergia citrea TaxID=2833581 RepID=UPI001BC94D7E|nr:flagellar protein FliT [Lederbergia citrea]MBS4178303.1 flagellar protein FliT [Lederbergia citrea]